MTPYFEAVGNGCGWSDSEFRYAMTSARSESFGMPAKPMAVPGMKPFGLAMNLLRSSNVQVPPLGLHGGREIEPASFTPGLADDAKEIRTDAVRAALLEGMAGAALLGGGGALLDRGGLEQLFDRLGGRSGGGAFLAVAGVFLHGDLKARLFRHLGREQRTRGEARHQQDETGAEHGTENFVEFERVHFRPGPTPQEELAARRPPGRASGESNVPNCFPEFCH
ncbi:hypothetical protein ACVWW3_007511 [Bradyrhizobium sp. LM2.9]